MRSHHKDTRSSLAVRRLCAEPLEKRELLSVNPLSSPSEASAVVADDTFSCAVVDLGDLEQNANALTFETTEVAKQYTMSWNAIDDAVSYNVKISRDGGETWITYAKPTETTCLVKSIELGSTYLFRVYGANAKGSSFGDPLEGGIAPVSVSASSLNYRAGETISVTLIGSDDATADVQWYSGDVEIESARGLLEITPDAATNDLRVVVTGTGYSKGTNAELAFAKSLDSALTFEPTIAANQYDMSWKGVDGAAGYNVKISRNGGETWVTYAKTTESSCVVKSLEAGKTYMFRVYAANAKGATYGTPIERTFAPIEFSSAVDYYFAGDSISVALEGAEEATADVKWFYITDDGDVEIEEASGLLEYTPADASHDIRVVATGTGISQGSSSKLDLSARQGSALTFSPTDKATRFTLDWIEITDAVSYNVKISRDGGETWITCNKPTETTCTVDSLKVGSTYLFRVYGANAKGAVFGVPLEGAISPFSLSASVQSYKAGTSISVTLEGDDVNAELRWYYVTDEGDVEIEDAAGLTEYAPTVANAPIKVVASGTGACAALSAELTIPVSATLAFDYNPDDRTATISWPEAKNAVSYLVQVSKDGGETWINYRNTAGAEDPLATSCTAKGFYPNASYYYRVLAVDSTGAKTENGTAVFTPFVASVNADAYTPGDTLSVSVVGSEDASWNVQWSYVTGEGDVEIADAENSLELTTEGAEYPIRIVVTGTGSSTGSRFETIVDYVAPETVELAEYDTLARTVTASWRVVNGASSYRFLRNDDGTWKKTTTITIENGVVTSKNATLSDDGTTISYTLKMINAGVSKSFRVVAVNERGAAIDEQEFVYAPMGLELDHDAYEVSGDLLTATLVPSTAEEEIQFQWYRSDDAGASWTALENATESTYTISAEDAAEQSWYKLVATRTEDGAQSAVVAQPRTLDERPLDLDVAVSEETGKLLLTFSEVENAKDYQIEYYLSDEENPVWINLTNVSISSNGDGTITATHANGANYQNYEYRVRATSADGLSAWNAFSPVAPENLSVGAYDAETSSVTLTWNVPDHTESFVVSGTVTDLEGNVSELESVALDVATTSYVFANVVEGYQYEFAVASINEVGEASTSAAFATALVSLNTDVATPGTLLKASLSAEVAEASYQWHVSNDSGETWTELEGANEASYTVALADVQTYDMIKVVATGTGVSAGSTSEAVANLEHALAVGQFGAYDALYQTATVTWNAVDAAESYALYVMQDDAWAPIVSTDNVSYTFDALNAGTTGECKLVALDAEGVTIDEREFAYTPFALVLENDAYNATGDTLVAATSEENAAYQWFSSSDSGETWTIIEGATNAAYTIEAQEDASPLWYKLVATNDAGAESVVYARPRSIAVPPYDLSVSANTETNDLVLSFSDNLGEHGYQVEYYLADADYPRWIAIADVATVIDAENGAVTATITGAADQVDGEFRVRSLDAVGYSAWDAVSPDAPANLAIGSYEAENASVTLTWDVPDHAESFVVSGTVTDLEGNVSELESVTLDANATSYVYANVVEGYEYRFTIDAVNVVGSASSSVEFATALVSLNADVATPGATLEASLNTEIAEASYQWYASNDSGETWTVIEDATSATYSVSIADVNAYGQIKVVATGTGVSAGSTSEAVANLEHALDAGQFGAYDALYQTATVTWNVVDDAESYALYVMQDETWTPIVTTTDVSYTFDALDSGTTGEYKLVALDAEGVTIDEREFAYTPFALVLENDAYDAAGDTLVATTSEENAAYQWFSSADSGETWTAVEDATNATFTIEAQEDAENVWYKLVATNDAGAESVVYARPRSIAVPPYDLSVSANTETNDLVLSFLDNIGEHEYQVEFYLADADYPRWIAIADFTTVVDAETQTVTATITGAAELANGEFRVRSLDNGGYSAWDVVSPEAPANLAISGYDAENASVTLTWDASVHVESFVVTGTVTNLEGNVSELESVTLDANATNYVYANVVEGYEYRFTIDAVNVVGAASASVAFATALVSLNADVATPGALLEASLNTEIAEACYQWYVSADSGETWTAIEDATDATYSVTIADVDAYNQIKVVATGTGVSAGSSSEAIANLEHALDAGQFGAYDALYQTATVTWNAVDDAESYALYVMQDDAWTPIVTTTDVSYTFDALDSGTTGEYKLVALDAEGDTIDEREFAYTPFALVLENDAYDAAGDALVAATSEENAAYHWFSSADSGETWTAVEDATNAAFTIDAQEDGATLWYKLVATNDAGAESVVYARPRSIAVPPYDLSVSADTETNDLVLSFSDSVGAHDYQVEYYLADADYPRWIALADVTTVIDAETGAVTATITGAADLVDGEFRVRSLDNGGYSAWDAVSPDAPANLAIESYNAETTSVTLTWDAQEHAEAFVVTGTVTDLEGNVSELESVTLDADTTTYVYSNVVEGYEYRFTIDALNVVGAASASVAFATALVSLNADAATPGAVLEASLNTEIAEASYQWYVSADSGETWTAIEDATDASYSVSIADVNAYNQIKVVATGTGVSAGSTSEAIANLEHALDAGQFGAYDALYQTVTVAWNAVDGAESYALYVMQDETWTPIVSTGNVSYTFNALDAGTTGEYKLVALDAEGVTIDEREFAYTPFALVLENDAYNAAGDPLVATTSDENAAYQWFSSSDSGETWTIIEGATNAAYTIEAQEDAENVWYKLVATNDAGAESVVYARPRSIAVPPYDLSVSANTETNDLVLSFSDNIGEHEYQVEFYLADADYPRWIAIADFTTVVDAETQTVTATITGAAELANGEFRVRSLDNVGYSAWDAVSPDAPANLAIESYDAETTSVTLTWDAQEHAESFFVTGTVTDLEGNVSELESVTLDASATNYVYANVVDGYEYRFTIDAVNVVGSASSTVSFATALVSLNADVATPGAVLEASLNTEIADATYQWYVSNDSGETWTALEDATSATYSVSIADVNAYGQIKVVATGTGASAGSSSEAVANLEHALAAGQFGAYDALYQTATVTWNAVDAAESYALYVMQDDAWTPIASTTDVSYTFDALNAGTTGEYKLVALDAEGVTIDEREFAYTPFALVLENDAYNAAGDTLVSATSDEDAAYQWFSSADSGETWTIIEEATNAAYTIDAQEGAENVWYKLVATNADGAESVVYARPRSIAVPPYDLAVSANTETNDLVLSFSDNIGEHGYQVEYNLADADYPRWIALVDVTTVIDAETGAVTATITGASDLVNGEFRVRSLDAIGYSAWDAVSPDAPANLAIDGYDAENASVTLTWDAQEHAESLVVTGTVTDLEGNVSELESVSLDASATNYVYTNVVDGYEYRFTIDAVNVVGAASASVAFATALVSLNADSATPGATLEASLNSEIAEASYQWYATNDSGETWTVIEDATSATYSVSIADVNVYDQIKVVATGTGVSEGSSSEAVANLEHALAAGQFGAYDALYQTATVTWNAVDDAESYALYVMQDDAWAPIASTTDVSYTFDALNAGTTSEYKLVALDAEGATIDEREFAYTPFALVLENDAYDAAGDTLVAATPEENAAYQWFSSADSGETWTAVEDATNAAYTIDAQEGAENVWYKLVATNADGAESVVYARPRSIAVPPYDLAVSANTETNDLILSFSDVVGTHDYQVEYYLADADYPRWIALADVTTVIDAETGAVTATITGAADLVDGEFRVRSLDAVGYSAWDAVSPDAPANLAIESYDAETTSVTLTWDAQEHAESFFVTGTVTDLEGNVSELESVTLDADATSYVYSNVVDGYEYRFTIDAVNVVGSASSTVSFATALVSLNADVATPGAVLEASLNTELAEASYQWYVSADSGETWTAIEDANDATYSVTIADVDAYDQIKVVATGTGVSAGSTSEAVANLEHSLDAGQFGAYDTLYQTATVKWNAVDAAESYALYVMQDDAWTPIASTTDVSYTFDALNAGTTGEYKLVALDAEGVTIDEREFAYTPFALVLENDAYDAAGDTLVAATPEEDSAYQWFSSADSGETWTAVEDATSATFTIDAREDGAPLWYKLVATNADNAQSVVYARPRLIAAPPYDLSVSADTETNDLVLSFSDSVGAHDYQVEYYLADADYPRWIALADVATVVDAETGAVTATITGAADLVDGEFRVRSLDAVGYSAWDAVSPDAPANLAIESYDAETTSVTLTWDAQEHAESFVVTGTVTDLEGNVSELESVTLDASATNYVYANVVDGYEYRFTIDAVNVVGSASSTVSFATALVSLNADSATPGATLEASLNTEIAEASYQWYASADSGETWTAIEGANAAGYSVMLANVNAYDQIKVVATGTGASEGSTSEAVANLEHALATGQFGAYDTLEQSVVMTWTGLENAASYALYVKEGDAWTQVYSGEVRVYAFSALSADVTSEYKLVAFDSEGTAIDEREFAYAPFVLALDVDAYDVVGDTLTATTDEENVAYQWFVSSDAGETWTAIEDANDVSYTIVPESFETELAYFKVVATNSDGVQGVAYARPRTLDDAPLDPIVSVNPESNDLVIDFSGVEGATGYQIERYLNNADRPRWIDQSDFTFTTDPETGVVTATLAGGADYANDEFRVRATDELGYSLWHRYSPVAPANLAVSGYDAENASVTLTWDAPEHAESLFVSGTVTDLEGNVSELETVALDAGETSYVYANVVEGFEYRFTVAAVNTVGEASASAAFATALVSLNADAATPGAILEASLNTEIADATYQWFVSNDSGETWTAIEGADNASYAVALADVNAYDQIKVVATGIGVSEGSSSEAVAKLEHLLATGQFGAYDTLRQSVVMAWTGLENAESYALYVKEDEAWSPIYSGEDRAYAFSALPANVAGEYRLVALDSEGAPIDERQFDYAPFALALDVDAYDVAGDALTATTDEENVAYQWFVSSDAGETWTVVDDATNASYTIDVSDAEDAAATVWYKLAATSDSGAVSVAFAKPKTLESAPLDLAVSVDPESNDLVLTFAAVDGAEGYQIERYLDDAETPVWIEFAGFVTTTDEGTVVATLADGAEYAAAKLRVRAFDAEGLSAWDMRTPVAPTNLVVDSYVAETRSVTISWDAQEHADRFEVRVTVTDLDGTVAELEPIALDADAASYTFADVVDGYGYAFSVAAITGVGEAVSDVEFATALVALDAQKAVPDATLNASLTAECADAEFQWFVSADDGETWLALEGQTGASIVMTDELVDNYARLKVVATGIGVSTGSQSEAIVPIKPYAGEDPSVVVTTSADVLDSTDGLISLREAFLYRTWLLEKGLIAEDAPISFDPDVFSDAAPTTIQLAADSDETYEYSRVYDAAAVGGGFLVETAIVVDAAGAGVAIDGANIAESVFHVRGENASFVLSGVTALNVALTSSAALYGGAIYAENARSLTIDGCSFVNNSVASALLSQNAIAEGGAVCVRSDDASRATTVSIVDSTFEGNAAAQTAKGGGAIFLGAYADATIDGCLFVDNTAAYDGSASVWVGGGAISVENATRVEIVKSTFRGNATSNVKTSGTTVTNRSAYAYGGAVYVYVNGTTFAPAVSIDASVFDGNRNAVALYSYGTTSASRATIDATNSIFMNDSSAAINLPASWSSGVAIDATNCTFVDNQTAIKNGSRSGVVSVANSILWGNATTFVKSVSTSTFSATNTLASSNTAKLSSTTNLWIADDDAVSPLKEDLTIDRDAASVLLADGATRQSVVDAGDDSRIPTETDLAGNARVVGDAVDLGAFELQTEEETGESETPGDDNAEAGSGAASDGEPLLPIAGAGDDPIDEADGGWALLDEAFADFFKEDAFDD